MSHVPPNPNTIAGPQINANTAPQFIQSQYFRQVPASQLPPGYKEVKQDANSSNAFPSSVAAQVNNYNQSTNSSPAFNQGIIPPLNPSLPMGPGVHHGLPAGQSAGIPRSMPSNPSPSIFPPNVQQRQNSNVPPLIPPSQTLVNGHPTTLRPSGPISQPNQYPNTSSAFPPVSRPVNTSMASEPQLFRTETLSKPGAGTITSQPNMPLPGPPSLGPSVSGPSVSSAPLNYQGSIGGPSLGAGSMTGPSISAGSVGGPSLGPVTISGPSQGLSNSNAPSFPTSGLPFGPQRTQMNVNGSNNFGGPPISETSIAGPTISRPPTSGPSISGPPVSRMPMSGPPVSSPLMSGPPILGPPVSGPPKFGPQVSGPPMSGPAMPGPPGPGPQFSGPPMAGPPFSGQVISTQPSSRPPFPGGPISGLPISGPPLSAAPGQQMSGFRPALPGQGLPPPPSGLQYGPMPPQRMPMNQYTGPQNGPVPPMGPGPQNGPPQANPQIGQPPIKNQGRYPQGLVNQQPQPQYNTQQMTNQMGQLSVTKQGFDQLWGHQMFDLLTCRQILPEYPEEPPEIRLGHQFADAPNCSSEIFRCTVNRIPETNSLLQKSRLPLGILIHPFKDLNHLPVIQCNSIVRCRACRTYINPFVYFVDSKRWKCNLCYRVNDLPDEFQYDPVSKSYGDPTRRPEIKSATIEFIAPSEYMLRPPQPAVYLFLCDVSQAARDSGYLQILCDTLKSNLDQLPGDARTQVGFICYDAHVHYYLMGDGLTRPKEMTVLDIDDVFLPSPESLLVNLGERRELVKELLSVLPQRHSGPGGPASALGAALQAAYKLMSPTGGRITVFQTCLPNVGPGALQPREDPNARSSADVQHINPATDFYKRLALDCSGAQVAVDLFLLNAMYCDLATLSGMSKFSGGSINHIPLFNAARVHQAAHLTRQLTRYLTRKIGFEAVMRVRCTRGISIHTFHGNFFVRSTDLLSLPNVSPDSGFGMQLAIDESLSDLQQVCFQAALLYTSSKGERRIRVHTLALPIASSLTDVLHSADQQCIIGLLAKMAVDRCSTASLAEAREALINVAIDALSAHRLAQNLPAGAAGAALHAPASLRLLPMYLLALLKRKAFRTGTSTRLDDRIMDMCNMKSLPLPQLMRAVYPDLYPIHELRDYLRGEEEDEGDVPGPPTLHLTAERINSTGAYLLDDGETMIIYVGHLASPAFLSDTFGVTAFSQLPDEARSLPRVQSSGNVLLHAFVDKLNDDRPYAANILVLRDNSPNRQMFIERLVEDRVESSFSYYEFLQHIKVQVK